MSAAPTRPAAEGATARTERTEGETAWLFSRPVDLAVFGGSALLAVALLVAGKMAGVIDRETPGWAWVPSVLLVDVAHVWATGFRTYFDRRELRRRPLLYALVPLGCYAAANAAYRVSEDFFWRALAYVAIVHFVRQQAGFMVLYRARANESRTAKSAALDNAAIYGATLGPLAYWHSHLPRKFDWFVPGDVAAIPPVISMVVMVGSATAVLAWLLHACILHIKRRGNAGKTMLVFTTALMWTLGIVVFDSDYAFTVTNVLGHGIPYVGLVFLYQRKVGVARGDEPSPWLRHLAIFVGVLFVCAYAEELLWDRSIYHERAWLFGEGWDAGALRSMLVPLLALPQLVHYTLDGFIWKRAKNPGVVEAPREVTGARVPF